MIKKYGSGYVSKEVEKFPYYGNLEEEKLFFSEKLLKGKTLKELEIY